VLPLTAPPDSLGNVAPDSLALAVDSPLAPPDSAFALLGDTLMGNDTLRLAQLKADSDLEAPVSYQAQDSILFDVQNQVLYLYGAATLTYTDLKLSADRIQVNWKENLMFAQGTPDSLGNLIGAPVFEEKGQKYFAEQITYNFKTQKGKIYYAKTNQSGDIVLGDAIKRNPDNTFFISNGKFTTCDADHPHFYFQSKKLKVIPQDRIISGPLQMVVADVPLPLFIPFGFFPFKTGRTSGIIIPEPGNSPQRGFFFRNLGYYWAASPYWDLIVKGDVFTKGGFRVQLNPRYKLMYKFDGDLSLEYSRQSFNEPGDPDYQVGTTFFVRWKHNQKFSPTASLTANVEAGSSSFLRRNSFNLNDIVNNRLQSSISFSKQFANSPWSLTANLNHSQDLARNTVTLTLPSINIARNRTFPFKRKVVVGKERWYEKIGYTYGLNLQNTITAADSVLFTPAASSLWRNGIRHTIAASTNLTALQYITLSPSLNYNEYWYTQSLERTYQQLIRPTGNKDTLIETLKPGFVATRDFNFRLAATTRLYGTRVFKNKSQTAVRHTLIPTLSYNYKPNFADPFWNVYRQVQRDSTGRLLSYSRFERGIYGGPTIGEQQALQFTLSNLIEMKYLPRAVADSAAAGYKMDKSKFKYVNLIDNIGLDFNYNFAADSLRFSLVNLSARTNLLGKINLQLGSQWDPYGYVTNPETQDNVRVDRLAAGLGQGWLRLVSATAAVGISLDDAFFKSKKKQAAPPSTAPKYEGYVDFRLPWRLNLNYSLSYAKPFDAEVLTHSLRVDGGFSFAEFWTVTFTSGYDFTRQELTITNFAITRDLHCWQFGLNVTPFGPFQSYFFTLSAKAPTLKDLKLTKQRNWQDQGF